MAKKTFSRKPFSKFLYTWSPQTAINDPKRKFKTVAKEPIKPRKSFCNATPGSNGDDFITTYVYNEVVDENNTLRRFAYVECGYVE